MLENGPAGQDMSTTRLPDRSGEVTTSRFYLPQLDGLRFLAFAAVFYRHLGETFVEWQGNRWWQATLDAGAWGVDLFFVLSGFLITSLLIREKEQTAAVNVRAFWLRRILRIWPLYFVFVGIVWAIERPPLAYMVGLVFFVMNWVALATRYTTETVSGILWSVQIEEQFYFCWPLALRRLSRRGAACLAAALIGVALATRAWVYVQSPANSGYERIWTHTFARLDPIAIGALLALCWPPRAVRLPNTTRPVVLGPIALLLVGIQRYWPLFPALHASAIWVYLAAALLLGGAVLVTIVTPPGSLAHPWLVYLGRISYGLYVVHLAVIVVVGSLDLPWFWRVPLILVLTFGLAAASYRLLEAPFLRLKERFTYVRSAPV
jgi:peptidoglycan/LPS O-acetylase OafA/YrhL